jgi:hypothetical protein
MLAFLYQKLKTNDDFISYASNNAVLDTIKVVLVKVKSSSNHEILRTLSFVQDLRMVKASLIYSAILNLISFSPTAPVSSLTRNISLCEPAGMSALSIENPSAVTFDVFSKRSVTSILNIP